MKAVESHSYYHP